MNYTGSTGYGAESIELLEGQIGVLDVQDVMACLDKMINDKLIDGNQVYLYGGSHGGFLIAWLTALYSPRFRAACMINPVIDLPSKKTVT